MLYVALSVPNVQPGIMSWRYGLPKKKYGRKQFAFSPPQWKLLRIYNLHLKKPGNNTTISVKDDIISRLNIFQMKRWPSGQRGRRSLLGEWVPEVGRSSPVGAEVEF
uniref:Uncharacterized protein n=1 Tax=Magallana gigas TaxID=29159 RepID=K1Q2N8_MAGGI